MSNQTHHIVILGGGFGGLSVANEIRNKLDSTEVKITVIDKKNWFMIGYVKLWIMQGRRTFENSIKLLDGLKKKSINFLNEEITKINLNNKTIETKSNKITYDYLIIALGAELVPEKTPGLIENGLILYDHTQLSLIHDKISSMKKGKIAIAIMGMPYKCPPAPFEAGMIINFMLKDLETRNSIDIHFYSPAPITLPAAGQEVSQQILNMINSENMHFHGLCKTTRVDKNKLYFEDGSNTNFDLLIAIPIHQAPKIIYDTNLAKKGEFIQIKRDCETSYENVYAIGDVTTMKVNEVMSIPKAGVFAEGEGLSVASSIISNIQHNKIKSLFDGKGGCFLESGKDKASIIQVDMFSEQKPITNITESTRENFDEKIKFEKDRFEKWL